MVRQLLQKPQQESSWAVSAGGQHMLFLPFSFPVFLSFLSICSPPPFPRVSHLQDSQTSAPGLPLLFFSPPCAFISFFLSLPPHTLVCQREQKELVRKLPPHYPSHPLQKGHSFLLFSIASASKPTSSFAYTKSMETDQASVINKTRKRKRFGCEFSLDELNQDLLEGVLSWLPASSFFSLRSVCKRWSSVSTSPTFKLACSRVPCRDPWFLMVDPHLDQSIIFDTTENNWKKLNYPSLLEKTENSKSIPVASAGGLVCFHTTSGDFIVSNPVTDDCRQLPSAGTANNSGTIHAIAMHSCSAANSSYRLVLVSGQLPHLAVKVYDAQKDHWEDEFPVIQKSSKELDSSADDKLYFLSKAGDVISTNMQRSPSKQFSSVLIDEGGEEVVYFLSSTGTVVACNLSQRSFSEYPRLLPVFFEYSIDLVKCGGEMLVVVLSELLESASLRVWRFSEPERMWHQVAAMPPSMSHELYGMKADINCVGHGNLMLICANADNFSRYIMCNLVSNEWIDLPKSMSGGEARDFLSAFSFEPRVEASV